MSETDFAHGYQPPAAPEPAAVEPEGEPAAWSGPSQEEWGSVMGYISAQQQAEAAWQAEQAAAAQQAPYAGLDPFNDSFGEQLGQIISDRVQQAISPLAEWQYAQQLEGAHDLAYDIIADDVARNGEFMLGEQAFATVEALANQYMPEFSERMGYGPKAAEAALAKAASEYRQYEQQLAAKAVERHMNQLATLGGAPAEPIGAGVGASSGYRVNPGGDELSVVTGFGGFAGRPTG